MEHVAANELPDGHGEVSEQAKSRNSHTSIMFVGRSKVDVSVMVMMVVVAMVATVVSGLGGHWR